MPASLQLIFNGQPLQTREVQGEDGVATVAVLEGVPAGSPSEAHAGHMLGLQSVAQGQGALHKQDKHYPHEEAQQPLIVGTLSSAASDRFCCRAPAVCASPCSQRAPSCARGRERRAGCTAGVGQGHGVVSWRR